MDRGKIVAIVGGPRCGKSYLASKLAAHFGAPVLFEGEEKDFPREVIAAMRGNINPVERLLYFRNKLVSNQIQANKLTQSHRFVFLDSCWVNNIPFAGLCEQTPFEKNLLDELSAIDTAFLPWPDVLIYLKTDGRTSRDFLSRGGRSFEATEEFIVRQIENSKKIFDEYYARIEVPVPLYTVDRTGLDFDKPEDLRTVMSSASALGVSD